MRVNNLWHFKYGLPSGMVLNEETFTYDAAGNILTAALPDGTENTYQYDRDNLINKMNDNKINVMVGNIGTCMINGKKTDITYDARNRLKKIGGDLNEYWYDPDSNRINMYYYHTNMQYLYDCSGGRNRLIWTSDHNENVTSYFYGAEGLLWSQCNGEYQIYHYDYRGSVVAVTDKDGNVTDTLKYDAYGSVTERTGTSALIFGYNGQYGVLTDPNGLLYMRTRFYNPDLKRFMNADILDGSIEDSTTLNLYTFVNGNPISYVDPFGMSADRGQKTTIYYGSIENSEDVTFGDKSKEELMNMGFLMNLDLRTMWESAYLFSMKNLTWALSVGKMTLVLSDMIDWFASGKGGEYSNKALTEIVSNHDVTQQFMNDVTEQFLSLYTKYNGDISAFANNDIFRQALRDNDVLLSKYSYGGGLWDKDTYTGLTFAIHQWTSAQVDLTSLNINENKFSGTLQFTFKDTFGLDTEDIDEFGMWAGFRSWYILQHYDKYKGQYRPFETTVTIDYDFSSQIN